MTNLKYFIFLFIIIFCEISAGAVTSEFYFVGTIQPKFDEQWVYVKDEFEQTLKIKRDFFEEQKIEVKQGKLINVAVQEKDFEFQ